METPEFPCIIPTLTKDYLDTRDHIYSLLNYFNISKIVFLGPEKLRNIIKEDSVNLNIESRVSFINGNDILSFDAVEDAYNKRLEEIRTETGYESASSAGWYYQQFLKLAYHESCEDEYYLCWDSDTIPLRNTSMFDDHGKPYFDVKAEYIPSYFDTIKKLFHMNKIIEPSFISGHLLFKKTYVSELISELMSSDFKGDSFFQKILGAVTNPHNGFSEFETYGTYVGIKHPGTYTIRYWSSMRNASLLVNRTELTSEDLDWLSTGFDAASFERYQNAIPELTNLFRNQKYRNSMNSDRFYEELLKSGLLGDYENGGLKINDSLCPA